MKLKKYIKENYKNQVDFAKKQAISKAQVTQWINKNFIVIDKILYSPRRELK